MLSKHSLKSQVLIKMADINECSSGVHGCVAVEQVCYNLVGSYVCINADGSFSAPGPTPIQGGSSDSLSADPRARAFEISNEVAQGRTPFIGGSGTLGVQGFPGTSPELGLTSVSQSQGRCPPGYSFNLETQACDGELMLYTCCLFHMCFYHTRIFSLINENLFPIIFFIDDSETKMIL